MRGVFVMLILISTLAGIGFYLSYRLHRGLVLFFPWLPFWLVLMFVAVLVILLVLGFGRSMLPFSDDIKHILGIINAFCMGIFLYLLLYTIVADLLFLMPRVLHLSFTAHRCFQGVITLCVLLLTGVTCLYGFINARQIDHISYDICLQDKVDISDMRVVMISDLHLGSIGSEDRLKKIVKEINALEPDVVCVAGDFFDTDFTSIRNPDAAIQTLREIETAFGTYVCLGNHDGGKTYDQMAAFLEQANIKLLNDAYTVIDNRLVLIGRLDASPIGGYGDQKRKPLSEFFIRKNPSLPVVVLDHNPANIGSYGAEADLVLCGHTHKGQVFPGSLITNAMYDVDYGYYRKDAQSPHVIVSSGIGSWGMPIRVGTNSEIVSIRFCNT